MRHCQLYPACAIPAVAKADCLILYKHLKELYLGPRIAAPTRAVLVRGQGIDVLRSTPNISE